MKIALDAMGGDNAPVETVKGAVNAAEELGYEIFLVGEEYSIEKELDKYRPFAGTVRVVNASEKIGMDEPAAISVRKKKDASINVCAKLVKEKKVDALITAGNTGAAVCAATLYLRTLEGIERPGISVIFPTLTGICFLIDVGANIDPKPEHLLQYAVMGDVYMRYIFNKEEVKVGLLSIGEEESKGTTLIKETHRLLDASALNFIGNVEGRDIFTGKCDVIVCDGFSGNIILKVSESIAETLGKLFSREMNKSLLTKIGGLLSMTALRSFKKKIDYTEIGGAPLLGVDGVCIISHGRSTAKAIKNAIKVAGELSAHQVNKHIIDQLKNLTT
ncbi:MAG: phosphate acyltransferase PlsX [Candidatus Omnitrophota bacterium]